MTMKPVEGADARIAYEKGKPVFALDRYTGELIHLNKVLSKGFIINAFSQTYYLYYVYEEKKWR